jgi:hypothetical protein
VLIPIAPVPTLKIIMTAATADNTPAITIAHPSEFLLFWLDRFGILDPQVAVNLLLELGVGVDLGRHGN